MKKVILISLLLTLSGCSTIQKYWPRPHDPVAFHQLVHVDISIEGIDCERPDWSLSMHMTQVLAKNAEWRNDPQAENLKGLYNHTIKMSRTESLNKTFCELGKKTAQQRINAVKSAWAGR
jgi:hypothetical protein